MLKFSLKTRQKRLCRAHARVGNGTENTYAYYCLRERLQATLLTANGNDMMEMQKQSATDSRF